MSRVFISYRRDDNPDGGKLVYERLKTLLPSWEIFYDRKSLGIGSNFPEELRQAVTDAQFVLVMIGPKWLELLKDRKDSGETDFVHEEIGTAFATGSGVIPVAVGKVARRTASDKEEASGSDSEEATFPSKSDLAEFPDIVGLAELNGKQVRPDPDFDKDVEALVGYLEVAAQVLLLVPFSLASTK